MIAALLVSAVIVAAGPQQADVNATAARVAEATNALRRSEGLKPLQPDAKLERAAHDFAEYMARTRKYGHEADGRDPPTRAEAAGYAYCLVLENIAYHYDSRGFESAALARLILDGWKASPPHRQNLLNPLAAHMAVAVARSPSNGYYYAVQMFALPRSASVKFEVRNPSQETVRYYVGSQAHTLFGRTARTHEVCAREPVRFDRLVGGEAVEPRSGDLFLVAPRGGLVTLQRR